MFELQCSVDRVGAEFEYIRMAETGAMHSRKPSPWGYVPGGGW